MNYFLKKCFRRGAINIFVVATAFFIAVSPVLAQGGVLDSVVADSNDFTFNLGIANGNQYSAIFQVSYVPGASHDICRVTTQMSSNASHVSDAVNLSVYLGPLGYASTTNYTDSGVASEPFARNDADVQVRGAMTSYNWDFTPCVTVVGAHQYWFVFSRDGSLDSTYGYQVYGNQNYLNNGNPVSAEGTVSGTASWKFGSLSSSGAGYSKPSLEGANPNAYGYIYFNGVENFSAFEPPNATTSLSNATANCAGQGVISGSICFVYQFLFVPSPGTLTQFYSLGDFLGTRIPFAYLQDIRNSFDSLSASSDQFETVTLNLHDIGLGSTSPMGNILPNISFFSSSTVSIYVSPTILSLFRGLISVSVYVGFVLYAYRRVTNLIQS